MNTILIVEDDKRLGAIISRGLREQGYKVSLALSGDQARHALSDDQPAAIILDLGLPDCDGTELLNLIRADGYRGPVIIATARENLSCKVNCLNAGADDYLVKPFDFAELLARLRAVSRRASAINDVVINVGEVRIDLVERSVIFAGNPVTLTPLEFDFMTYLAQNAGQVVSRSMLAEHVWHQPARFTPIDNVIDVHVVRLRRKFTTKDGYCPLRVIRGLGIKLVEAR